MIFLGKTGVRLLFEMNRCHLIVMFFIPSVLIISKDVKVTRDICLSLLLHKIISVSRMMKDYLSTYLRFLYAFCIFILLEA